jgi:outer membrane protein assembly factor BamA
MTIPGLRRQLKIAVLYIAATFFAGIGCFPQLRAQDTLSAFYDKPAREMDLRDVLKKMFGKTPDSIGIIRSTIAILPSIGYNPSIGFQLGCNITGGKYMGPERNTTMSIFTVGIFGTTKGILTAQIKHNVFTKENEWNLQGNWQASRTNTLDYGVGTGITKSKDGHFSIYGLPLANDSALFPINFTYFRFTERVYRAIAAHMYVGLGLSFDLRYHIDDEKHDSGQLTPHYAYNRQNGFDTLKYNAAGILIDWQYNTKEHPNRPYAGSYADIGFRLNQTWIGSTKNSLQLLTEYRKYWSLSHASPAHVLAFWHWGSYLLSGKIPYLELPGTAGDTYARSGRGYTAGRFKGLSFFYAEMEYRFPILANGFMSGVLFSSVQTASNQAGHKLFQYWEPAVGGGLRFLFKKNTRTNICVDYGRGKYGSNGIFFGLNEVF